MPQRLETLGDKLSEMSRVTKQEFRRQFSDSSFSVKELKSMERLKGLDVEWADLNRDGVIKGDNEVTALFCNLAVGKDRFELVDTY